MIKTPVRYDPETGDIRDATEKVIASYVFEHGQQIADVLNATATPEGCTPYLELLEQRNYLNNAMCDAEDKR